MATAQKNLVQSRETANDALYFALSAMLMMYFAFEGYLNWLGHLIAPEVWESEKNFFNKAPYQGTLGKYLFLSKVLVMEPLDKSKGPFQTVKDLQQLRDKAEKNVRHLVNELHQVAKVHYPDVMDTSEPFIGILGFDITDN